MARRRSLFGPVVLIGLGILLLYSSLRSNWGVWEVIWRYWPVILIAWGLGKLWDHFRARETGESHPAGRFTGGELAMAIALVVLVGVALTHKPAPIETGEYHSTQTIPAQGAKAVHAEIRLGAGDLELAGGGTDLLEGDFTYNRRSRKPEVTYNVTGSDGELNIREPESDHIQFGGSRRSYWNVRFSNQVPLDLSIKMGAGTGRLNLNGMQLSHFSVEGGAGTLDVDMSGDWKKSIDGHIAGGVGTVTVHLPTNVGVSVRAGGGLGSVNAAGFERDGNVYVNSLYGKSPVSITLDIQGGIGTINLETGP
jgi:hypothetical protein